MALQQGSLAQQISELAPGESLSRSKMVGLSRAGLEGEVREAKRKMRNHLNKHADRAAQATGNTYRLDTGTWVANEDSALFVTVAVTRSI